MSEPPAASLSNAEARIALEYPVRDALDSVIEQFFLSECFVALLFVNLIEIVLAVFPFFQ